MIHGVGRDANHVAEVIAGRTRAGSTTAEYAAATA